MTTLLLRKWMMSLRCKSAAHALISFSWRQCREGSKVVIVVELCGFRTGGKTLKSTRYTCAHVVICHFEGVDSRVIALVSEYGR